MQRIRILVPVSLSGQSENALIQARVLAGQINGMLTCLHVIEQLSFLKGRLSRDMEMKIRRDAEIRLSEKVNQIIPGNNKVPFEIIVTSGKPCNKILEKTAELHADLIIMGKSDSPDPREQRLGFNTAKVLTGSTVPVLTVFSDRIGAGSHIVLPLDMADAVTRKISRVIEIAGLMDAKVSICSFLRREDLKYRAACEEKLRAVRGVLAEHQIECTTLCLEAWKPITGEILDLDGKIRTDDLFMMTHTEAGP